jgi:hypothetical protein
MSMANVFECISGNTFKRVTDEVRAITDVIEQGKYKARNFHYVTFSGTFTSRANKSLKAHSGLLCIDVDKLDNVAPLRLQIIEALPPSLLFVSPRGNGLKLVYKIAINEATHLDYFFAFRQFFKEKLNIKIDDSCKDVSRACFLSHDPDAYFNNGDDTLLDKAFIDTFPLDILHTPKKDNKSVTVPESSERITVTDYDAIMDNLKVWLDKKETFQEGNRNNYITRLANACNRYGIAESFTLSALEQYARNGFTVDGIRKTVESVYRHTDRFGISEFDKNTPHSFAIEPPEATPETTPLLPIDGMPEYLQSFINEYIGVYNSPRDYIAASVIFSTALAIGDKLELKTKFDNVPLLWMALIGNVSTGKTHPLEMCLSYFQKRDSEAYKDYKQKKDVYDAEKSKPKKEQDTTIPEPACFQYLLNDYTPETVREIHSTNERGIAIYKDELMGWLNDFNRYNKNGAQTTMLSTYYRVPMTFNRVGKAPMRIEKPCMLLSGGIQQSLLKTLADDNRADNGFLSRVMAVYPDTDEKGDYSNNRFPEESLTRYFSYLEYFANIPEACNLTLTSEAEKVYSEWYNKNAQMTNRESSGYLQGVYGKLDVFALRLAIVVHGMKMYCDEEITSTINEGTMQYAVNLTEYFRCTAKKVYRKIFANSGKEEVTKKDIIKFLHESGKSQSEIARFLECSQPYVNKVLKI